MIHSAARSHLVACVLRAGVLTLTVLIAGGCGGGPPPTGTTSGKVMLGDAPVKAGQVVFTNTDPKAPKPNSVTVPFTEGSYAAGALTTGTYNVHVLPPAAGPAPAKTDEIPEKYRKAETSGLTTTVKAGGNTFDIMLTK